jgi:glycosyltransferase involved in cell wall biosynthesis
LIKILHITAHVGGGIGSAFIGLGSPDLEQTVILLEEPINKKPIIPMEAEGFRILICPDCSQIKEEIEATDIVMFSWSHHPAITKFMYEFPEIPVRSVLWVHVSGNYFPVVKAEFLRLFDQVVFATPYTLSLPEVQSLGSNYIIEHFDVVYGMGDLKKFIKVQKVPHEKFVIGYVGTLNFCKLHPDFIDFCTAVDISNVEFALIGDSPTRDELLQAAQKKGIADKFKFYGHVDNIPEQLARMDAFGYLLNPQHYGATENALLEAMAAGVPVIALDQCVERYIIHNGVTGLLVQDPQAYSTALRSIYEKPDFALSLASNARNEILQHYSIEDNRKRLLSRFNVALSSKKRQHCFKAYLGESPSDWFLSAVGPDNDCFLENHAQDSGRIFHESTKGSPQHYHNYFPEDKRLALWSRQLKYKNESVS